MNTKLQKAKFIGNRHEFLSMVFGPFASKEHNPYLKCQTEQERESCFCCSFFDEFEAGESYLIWDQSDEAELVVFDTKHQLMAIYVIDSPFVERYFEIEQTWLVDMTIPKGENNNVI